MVKNASDIFMIWFLGLLNTPPLFRNPPKVSNLYLLLATPFCGLLVFSDKPTSTLTIFRANPPMTDWSGMMSKPNGFGGGRNNEDFEEEDVWSFVKSHNNNSPVAAAAAAFSSSSSSSSASAWRLPTASRTIPSANSNPPAIHEVLKSAPVAIPDWSKIYGKSAKIGSWVHHHDDGDVHGVNGDDDGDGDGNGDGGDNDDGGDDDDMVPPHEWVARKLARSQISSFSVCEGIGRTLKGRDLSKEMISVKVILSKSDSL